ncbi:MAG: O-antigen ligase family protein [Actinobacteria bacterium]|nr:O-antigen ligase family protein [Actinomycetota bacterium]
MIEKLERIDKFSFYIYLALGILIGVLAFISPFWTILLASVFLLGIVFFKDYKIGLVPLVFFLPFQRLLTFEFKGYTIQLSYVLAIFTLVFLMIDLIVRGFIDRRDACPTGEEHRGVIRTPLGWPLLVFMLTNFISTINAINKTRSFAIMLWALASVAVYYAVVNLIRDKETLVKTMNVLITSAAVVSLFGLYQFVASYIGLPTFLRDNYLSQGGYLTRIHSTTLEPLIFASYLLIVIPVAVSLLRIKDSSFKHSKLILNLLLMCSALFLTLSRGGFAGLIISLAVIFLLSKNTKRYKGLYIKIVAVFVLAVVVFSLFLIVIAPQGTITTTIYQGTIARVGSSAERAVFLKAALRMFLKSPFLGIGVGNFGPYYNKLFFLSTVKVGDFRMVNNVPVEILAETGIFGFLAGLWLWLSYVVNLWKVIRKTKDELIYSLSAGFMAGFMALSFQYLTFSPFYAAWTWFLLGAGMALVRISRMNQGV